MKKLFLLLAGLSILLNCSSDKKSEITSIEQLLSHGNIINAYFQYEKVAEQRSPAFANNLLQANIYAAASFESPDSLPTSMDTLITITARRFHQLFSVDSLKDRALFNYGFFCYHQGWLDSSVHYLKKFHQIDSVHVGCISLLLASSLNQGDWQESTRWGELLMQSLMPAKWFLLEAIKNITFPESGVLIVLRDDCKVEDQHGSTKYFSKYDLVEYTGSDLNSYHIKNWQIGWIPEDMRWFRGIFEPEDYSLEGNIYTAPGSGYRIRKNLIRPGSVRRLAGTATSTSGLGIIRSGWYQVEFEMTTPMMMPKNMVIPSIMSIEAEKKRIEKLVNLTFLTDDDKGRLLESLVFREMPLPLFEISIPYAHLTKFIPLRDKVRVIYQFKTTSFIFENGFLTNWLTLTDSSNEGGNK